MGTIQDLKGNNWDPMIHKDSKVGIWNMYRN